VNDAAADESAVAATLRTTAAQDDDAASLIEPDAKSPGTVIEEPALASGEPVHETRFPLQILLGSGAISAMSPVCKEDEINVAVARWSIGTEVRGLRVGHDADHLDSRLLEIERSQSCDVRIVGNSATCAPIATPMAIRGRLVQTAPGV
jgi:hypothetical protein